MTAKPPTAAQKSAAKLAYEQQRAAKAGQSHEEWLKTKARTAEAAKKPAAKPVKKPGLLSRLLDKAHKPIGSRPGGKRP